MDLEKIAISVIVTEISKKDILSKWTTKNVNQLLDDIDESMKAGKELYRVGTHILHKHVKHSRLLFVW